MRLRENKEDANKQQGLDASQSHKNDIVCDLTYESTPDSQERLMLILNYLLN